MRKREIRIVPSVTELITHKHKMSQAHEALGKQVYKSNTEKHSRAQEKMKGEVE